MFSRTACAALAACAVMTATSQAAAPKRLTGSCVSISGVASPTRLVATGFKTFLLYDASGQMPVAGYVDDEARTTTPGPPAEWRVEPSGGGRYRITSAQTGASLTGADSYTLAKTTGCRVFPDAELDATGKPFKGRLRSGKVFGIADAHMHLMAEFRAGGRVIYGENFDRFGIARALGHDSEVHGPNGVLDITGNLLRAGVPVGTHGNDGWPTFSGWPTWDTVTHQQIYYRWLQRAWLGGLRLIGVQTVEDQSLCAIEPLKSHSCDESATVRLQVARLRELQDYVDAQAGGRGKGWLRIVEDPRAARRAIQRGQLAVVIGIEWSDPFGCSEFRGTSQCTRADIDRRIQQMRDIGVRGVFVAHWVDNALAGAAIEGGAKGTFISALEAVQTGAFFSMGKCPEAGQGEEPPTPALPSAFAPLLNPLSSSSLGLPLYASGKQCNPVGLSPLGAYAINRLMDSHMLIEADHLSEVARRQVLDIAEKRHYPLVSSHTDTGGFWTNEDLVRLHGIGGFATATLDSPKALAAKVVSLKSRGGGGSFGIGLGTDTGGFNNLPGPNSGPGTVPLAYPFKSYDGKITFGREQTGTKAFDFNKDGMAHYGLMPDLLAAVRAQPDGAQALKTLFGSAEAYLRMWALTGD